jgi:hypothetical protein
MAVPGDEMAAGAGGRDHLRASHADREQVIGTLKAAFVQGMVAKDEFDLRVGQTLAAVSVACRTASWMGSRALSGIPGHPPVYRKEVPIKGLFGVLDEAADGYPRTCS